MYDFNHFKLTNKASLRVFKYFHSVYKLKIFNLSSQVRNKLFNYTFKIEVELEFASWLSG